MIGWLNGQCTTDSMNKGTVCVSGVRECVNEVMDTH